MDRKAKAFLIAYLLVMVVGLIPQLYPYNLIYMGLFMISWFILLVRMKEEK